MLSFMNIIFYLYFAISSIVLLLSASLVGSSNREESNNEAVLLSMIGTMGIVLLIYIFENGIKF